MKYLLVLVLLVLPLAAQAGNHSLTLTANQETVLLAATNAQNAAYVANGTPEKRYCTDDPLVCGTPDAHAYLVSVLRDHLLNFAANKQRNISLKIGQYCELTPTDQRCIDLGALVP
jgi:hypothetical protein